MALSQAQQAVTAKPGEQQALVLLAAGAQAPDQQAEERRRAKRMAPEGDQRLHCTPGCQFHRHERGVAKFYK